MAEPERSVERQILPLTLIRTVLNTGFRMVYPFQPFFLEAFDRDLPPDFGRRPRPS